MINKDSIILDIVEKYPESEKFFNEYNDLIGKCLMCSYLFESLDEIAKKEEIEINEFVMQLDSFIKKNCLKDISL